MVSIIIVNYNQKNFLKQCLKNIKEANLKLDYEIIVVDNNSTDGSREILTRFKISDLRFKIILNRENLGFAKANNQGIKLSQGKYILILNPDIIVLPGAIEVLYQFMEAHPEVTLCGPKLLNPDKSIQYSCCRFPTLYTPVLRRTFLGKVPFFRKKLEEYLMKDFDHARPCEVDWLLGAALAMRRSGLDKIGFFDERFFLYFEDVDLARRAHKAGLKVYYVPASQMYHFHQRLSATHSAFPALFSKITWIHIASAIKYFWKWSPTLHR